MARTADIVGDFCPAAGLLDVPVQRVVGVKGCGVGKGGGCIVAYIDGARFHFGCGWISD